MPRKERINEPGFYHVVSRGVERRNVFLDGDDFDKFLSILSNEFVEHAITLHAFCLMTNHYHLLIETKERNISSAMKRVNSLYSIYFNKRHNRTGHLWQGRFASYFLYDDTHFWYVAKYIERNPIKAHMVKAIDHYKYQSFFQRKYKLEHLKLKLIENSKIFDMNLSEYEEFISSDIDAQMLAKIYMSPKCAIKDGEIKILSKRIESFFEDDRDIDRNTNIKRAYLYGYTISEIADYLNLSFNAVKNVV